MKQQIKGPLGAVIVVVVLALSLGLGFWYINKPQEEGPAALKMKRATGHMR